MSFDSPEKNAAWAEHEGFPFELWSDTDRTLAKHYGAVSSALQPVPWRVTKVLDAEGRLVLEYTDVDVSAHPADVLEDVEHLFGDAR